MADIKRFAVLIDIENVSQKYIGLIMDEASNYGDLTIKRAYGDWTQQSKEHHCLQRREWEIRNYRRYHEGNWYQG